MYHRRNEIPLCSILRRLPDGVAVVQGGPHHPNIEGTVKFYQTAIGVFVVADILGLPSSGQSCKNRIFGFHIHSGSACSGNGEDPFANAGAHYNPEECPHPHHAGDMPPLFGADGRAFLAFLTSRFDVGEVVGKTVVIHDRPDDFTTQPAGNAGNKIACGVIRNIRR